MSELRRRQRALQCRVFLSYSHSEVAIARQVRAALEEAGARVFLAEDSVPVGDSLQQSIEAAIRECDLFVLLWSKAASESAWVPNEFGQALGLKKRVAPFVLDAEAPIPSFLGSIKYIRAYDGIDIGLGALAAEVGSLLSSKRANQSANDSRFFALLALGAILLAARGSN